MNGAPPGTGPGASVPSGAGTPAPPATPLLSATGITVHFGGRPALADISLDIPRGKIVALIGPSLSGKTTLLYALCRMNELIPAAVTTGSVRFEGTELYAPEVDPAEVRRRIGVVLQDAALFPGSIFHNVAFGPRASGFGGDLHALAEEVLAAVGLWAEVGGDLDLPASALSAGQRQRLCIARTLAVRPRVLLLDEPALALDREAAARIESLIHALAGDLAVVVATNDLRLAARVSEVTAHLDRGELVECGPTATVFTNPRSERTESYLTGRIP